MSKDVYSDWVDFQDEIVFIKSEIEITEHLIGKSKERWIKRWGKGTNYK